MDMAGSDRCAPEVTVAWTMGSAEPDVAALYVDSSIF
jgi:hypothetical protein